LAPAARWCHARHKALPRPLQTFATPAANVSARLSVPFTSARNPFYIGFPPLFPLVMTPFPHDTAKKKLNSSFFSPFFVTFARKRKLKTNLREWTTK
jgi:hypothetical protein